MGRLSLAQRGSRAIKKRTAQIVLRVLPRGEVSGGPGVGWIGVFVMRSKDGRNWEGQGLFQGSGQRIEDRLN